MSKETTRAILKEAPDIIVLGGPPAYLEGVRVRESLIQQGIKNAAKIASNVPTVLFEHHILRSEDWMVDAKPVYDAASKAHTKVVTGADYLNRPTNVLEPRRLALYKEEEPSPEFIRWTELPRDRRRFQIPPI
jgi:predicted metallo-beta-lactamase superfamily hydrolase